MSKRTDLFQLRINSEEREMIGVIANRLERTPTDALRIVIREVAASLSEQGRSARGGIQNPSHIQTNATV